MNPQVHVERWVLSDLFALPLSRPSKLKLLNDLHFHLPANYARLRGNRCEKNSSCFWYGRMTVEDLKVHLVRFAVDDSTPNLLRILWVEHVAG